MRRSRSSSEAPIRLPSRPPITPPTAAPASALPTPGPATAAPSKAPVPAPTSVPVFSCGPGPYPVGSPAQPASVTARPSATVEQMLARRVMAESPGNAKASRRVYSYSRFEQNAQRAFAQPSEFHGVICGGVGVSAEAILLKAYRIENAQLAEIEGELTPAKLAKASWVDLCDADADEKA